MWYPYETSKVVEVCLNGPCGRVQAGKYFSNVFTIRNGLKQGDALSPLLFNVALEYAIRRIPVDLDGLKLIFTHQLLVYVN